MSGSSSWRSPLGRGYSGIVLSNSPNFSDPPKNESRERTEEQSAD